jgi:hypothetical protein
MEVETALDAALLVLENGGSTILALRPIQALRLFYFTFMTRARDLLVMSCASRANTNKVSPSKFFEAAQVMMTACRNGPG